ncbi:MAG: hypothetical protein CL912_27765 [Deltaproteobacteria bacterium]|nr:hypothetical protein [Deltaproteobacteria bacterium]
MTVLVWFGWFFFCLVQGRFGLGGFWDCCFDTYTHAIVWITWILGLGLNSDLDLSWAWAWASAMFVLVLGGWSGGA